MNLQMAREICVIVCPGLLFGCAGAPIAPTVQRVEIPVQVSCLPDDLPERPATKSNDELRAMSSADYVLVVSAERLDLKAYAAKAEAAISGCR